MELPLSSRERPTHKGRHAECCKGMDLVLEEVCKTWGCLGTFQGGFGPFLLLLSALELLPDSSPYSFIFSKNTSPAWLTQQKPRREGVGNMGKVVSAWKITKILSPLHPPTPG